MLSIFYNALSKATAVVLHPLLMPIYCTMLLLYGDTPFHGLGAHINIRIVTFVGLYACIYPLAVLGIFIIFGYVKDLEMKTKRERIVPLLAISLTLGVSFFILDNSLIPRPIIGMLCGESVVLFAAAVCTIFWRISLHAIGAGGLIAFVVTVGLVYGQDFAVLLSAACLASGFICWARLYEVAHSPKQVLAGFMAGLGVMSVFMFLYINNRLY